MSAAHPRCAAAVLRALASPPRVSPPRFVPPRALRSPSRVSVGRPSTVMSSSRRDARDAAADVGLGGDGRGMRWCDRCTGEGVLVSLTKAQKRARRLARDDARPPLDSASSSSARLASSSSSPPPLKSLPCAACGGAGVVPSPDGELPPPSPGGPTVAVVGAGIGGAALALALQQRGVRVAVFERDASFAARKQGYGLTMQRYSGGAALRALGIALEGQGSDANVSLASDGRELGRYGHSTLGETAAEEASSAAASDGGRNVHLPRQALRRALLERLAPGTVRWGTRVTDWRELEIVRPGGRSSDPEGDGVPDASDDGDDARPGAPGVAVTFDDGATRRFDLLVGADGIFSGVRERALENAGVGADAYPLRYLGVLVVLGICRGVRHPLCDRKVFQVVDGETRVYAMPFTASPDGDGAIPPAEAEEEREEEESAEEEREEEESAPGAMMWQLSFPCSEGEARALARDPEGLLAEASRRCGTWPSPVPELLRSTTAGCLAGYPAYDRECLDPRAFGRTPAETASVARRVARVTLVGDAAHPMSPFKGQGANQALLDAVALARALTRAKPFEPPGVKRRHGCARRFEPDAEAGEREGGVGAALAAFEAEMCARSEEKVRRSRDAAAYLHSPAALAEGNCVRAHAAQKAARDGGVTDRGGCGGVER